MNLTKTCEKVWIRNHASLVDWILGQNYKRSPRLLLSRIPLLFISMEVPWEQAVFACFVHCYIPGPRTVAGHHQGFHTWADSLPLCSRLDLASVSFFYFGCETGPLLLAPCHSLGESRLLQLQRLQVPQGNHWGSQQERPAALPGAPGRSWQHSSSGLWQETRVGELALLPKLPGAPYLSSSLSFFWLFFLLFHLLSLLFIRTQKGKINILCFSCHQYQMIQMHTSICHSLQTPRNTHKEDTCFSSEGRIQHPHNSDSKALSHLSQGNYTHVFDS